MGNLIGDRVRELRLARGMDAADLAQAAGISPGYVSLIENNRRRNIPLKTLTSIASALGVTVSDLLPEGIEEQLLVREPKSDYEAEDPLWHTFLRAAKNLTPDERKEILDYIRFKRSQRKQQK